MLRIRYFAGGGRLPTDGELDELVARHGHPDLDGEQRAALSAHLRDWQAQNSTP
jgi:hypothetical protein